MLVMLAGGGLLPKGSEADAHDARWAGCGPKSATQLMLLMLAGGGLLPKAQRMMLMMLVGWAAVQRAPPI